MRRASDAVLLEHLWVTGALNESDMRSPLISSLEAFIERLGRHENLPEVRAWIACSKAHLALFRDLNPRHGYAILEDAASEVPDRGRARAYFEYMCCHAAFSCGRSFNTHAVRGEEALSNLPDSLDLKALREGFRVALDLSMPLSLTLKRQAARIRYARRRRDLGSASVARLAIAQLLSAAGYSASAFRHLELVAAEESVQSAFSKWGMLAATAGQFKRAIELLNAVDAGGPSHVAMVFLSAIWQRLGQFERARVCTQSIDPATLASTLQTGLLHAQVRSALARRDGTDPLVPFHDALQAIQRSEAPPLALDLLNWEVQSRTAERSERIDAGRRLAKTLESTPNVGNLVADVLVDLAEAELEPARRRELALNAARMLRRRRTGFYTMIESTCRCASLLQDTDPAEAASLRHVARRWVVQALPHVPDFALHSYVYDVPIHRQLLGDDAQAAAAGTFDLP
jgi:hypothetical protein